MVRAIASTPPGTPRNADESGISVVKVESVSQPGQREIFSSDRVENCGGSLFDHAAAPFRRSPRLTVSPGMASGIPAKSWMSPDLAQAEKQDKGGRAIVARAPIRRGELLAVFGGRVLPTSEFNRLPEEAQRHSLQVDDDSYLVDDERGHPTESFNHSCDPNAVIHGPHQLVARRDIAKGEEVCFDYATTDSSPYDEFSCQCGTADCRGLVTGNDWKSSDVQKRYRNEMSPYLQRRIEAAAMASRAAV